MNKLSAFLFTLFLSVNAIAENTGWQITEVPNKDNNIVGYIYHVGSIGTQTTKIGKTEKVATSLRFVCSTKISTQRDNDPIIVLFWDTMDGSIGQYIVSQVSGKSLDHMYRWEQEGPVMMRSVNESKDLIMELKTGKNIKFYWHDKVGTLRTTIFDLQTFKSHLAEFNTLCKTNL